jgi:dipeptidyl aminopeptidase/acylaminoacyl peptidase
VTAPQLPIVGDDGELLVELPVERRSPPPALEAPDLLADPPQPARPRRWWVRSVPLRLWHLLLLAAWILGIIYLRTPPPSESTVVVPPQPHVVSQRLLGLIRSNDRAAFSDLGTCAERSEMWDAPLVVAHRRENSVVTHLYLLQLDIIGTFCRLDVPADFRGIELPRWSPDGTRILFSAIHETERNLFVWQPSDQIERLPSDPGHQFGADWTPRGDAVWYLGIDSIHEIELLADGRTGAIEHNDSPTGTQMYDLAISPLEPMAAYTATSNASSSNAFELYVIRTTDQHNVRLTNDNLSDRYPTWSPDGRWLAWVHGTDELWIYDVVNNRRFPFLDSRSRLISNPVWLPDNDGIAFILQVGNQRAIVTQMFNGEQRFISRNFTNVTDFDWR